VQKIKHIKHHAVMTLSLEVVLELSLLKTPSI
jgi:hypothetical protein